MEGSHRSDTSSAIDEQDKPQEKVLRQLGLTIPLPAPLLEHRELFPRLADAGYTTLWTTEAAGTDAFTPLVLAAAWEPRLGLGTGIASVFTRGPALLAQSAAALAEVAPGRVTIGVGTSSAVFVRNWNSIDPARPYQRADETLQVLRRALNGERVDFAGETLTVRGLRLERPPATPPLLVLAALRRGMIRLAARAADGIMINWLSANDVRTVAAEYAAAGGRGQIVDRIMVCPNPDADHVRRAVKPLIARYLSVPGYAEFQRWLGRGDQLSDMWEAWAAGDRDAAARAVPDSLVDELVVHGTPEQCREGLAAFVSAGVTMPVVAVMPYGVDPVKGALSIAED